MKLFSTKRIGQQKEQQAKRWLIKQGFKIIAENYHCKGGEIDLIGLEKNSNNLRFFEVKFRTSASHGHPSEMVGYHKQQHLILCAQKFLQKHPQYQDHSMQFDVLSFTAEQKEPEWIENAFLAY